MSHSNLIAGYEYYLSFDLDVQVKWTVIVYFMHLTSNAQVDLAIYVYITKIFDNVLLFHY